MIVHCDTHFMPKDAFDSIAGNLAARAPRLEVDGNGVLTGIRFDLPVLFPLEAR